MIGHEIAEEVYKASRHLEWQSDPPIAVRYDEPVIRLRKPTHAELEAAKQIVSTSNYETLQVNDAGLRSIYAREQVLLHELPDELRFPLQAIKIGAGIIGGMGGEIFAETGLWLKARAAAPYFTIGLANGNCGYVPPAHEFALGGYETWRSRTSKLQTEAEEILKAKQLELIHLLCNM